MPTLIYDRLTNTRMLNCLYSIIKNCVLFFNKQRNTTTKKSIIARNLLIQRIKKIIICIPYFRISNVGELLKKNINNNCGPLTMNSVKIALSTILSLPIINHEFNKYFPANYLIDLK